MSAKAFNRLSKTILKSVLLAAGIAVASCFFPAHAFAIPGFGFTQFSDGVETYGDLLLDGDYRYYFEFAVTDDTFPITAVEYSLDGGPRVDISAYSTSGALDSTLETFEFSFNQVPYADGNPHNITFYATNSNAEENFESLDFQPNPDVTVPVYDVLYEESGTVSTTSLNFQFWALDDALIVSASGYIDAPGNSFTLTKTSGGFSDWYFDADVDISSYLDGNEHTIYMLTEDPYGNIGTQTFAFTYVEVDVTAPSLGFTASVTGLTDSPVVFTGSATDNETPITSVEYVLDGGARQTIFPIVETSTDNLKNFTLNFTELSEGAHSLIFYATNNTALEGTSATFNFTVDSVAPSCSASWTNKSSPYYSKTITYSDVVCTDTQGITDAAFRVYHASLGELESYAANHLAAPDDASYGGTTEIFSFTIDLTSLGDIDGNISIEFATWDGAGNQSYDLDPFVMESTDSTNPTVHLDEVLPDGLTDTTPIITGSCTDDTYRDTNSYISLLEYKIDAGAYQSITLLNAGSYNDSYTEQYSVQLASLAAGSHTVTVRCTDASTRSATTSDTFTIESPVDPVPGEYTFTETFTDYDHMDIPSSSNIIWGNGQLRLKETITTSLTSIHSADKCSRYGDDCRGDWGVKPDPVDPNIIWYMQGGKFFMYNTQTLSNTQFDYATQYSMSPLVGQINGWEVGVYNGKKYFIGGDDYSMVLINITDGVGYRNTSFNVAFYSFEFDLNRGQMGAYVVVTPSGLNSALAYLNMNNTTDTADDTLTPIPLSKINSTSIFVPFLDAANNAIYVGASSDGIYKFNDNDDPTNHAGYVVTNYVGYSEVYDHMLLDAAGHLIFGTSTNSAGKVYIVLDDNDTPFNAADDTIQELSQPIQLGYKDVRGLQYVEGQNGVGDQLFIATSDDNPVYFNFNDTYTNLNDDTFIELPTNGGVRPNGSNIYVHDYTTMYANNPRQGFYKVSLTRGWASSGQAVALPTRPPQQLVVDNFVANANVAGTIALGGMSDESLFRKTIDWMTPDVYAAGEDGVLYYVSTDGGITWSQVTLNQLQQLQQEDYRIKFKIELAPVSGATPVLDSYSLSYAGYPTPDDATTVEGLAVTSSSTSTTTGTSFNVTVTGVDTLGFKVPTYSGTITLSLIDTTTNAETTGLNQTGLTVSGGATTLTGTTISKAGSFKIRATDGSFTADSATITISSAASSLPSTTVGFFADSYKITKGQSTRLHWNGSNVETFKLNPGDITLSGDSGTYLVTPQTTTRYELTGTGDSGTAHSALTIEVVDYGDLSSSSASSSAGLATDQTGNNAETTDEDGITIVFTPDQTILKGQKATIAWDVTGADNVSIDYLSYPVGIEGSFDFFPEKTVTLTLTATRGEVSQTRTSTVTVIETPVIAQQLARDLETTLPGSGRFLMQAVLGAQTIARSAFVAAFVTQLAIGSMLLISVLTQGSLSHLNGQSLASILRAAGFLPYKKRKGFIHQTRTGKPIPFAMVTIFDAAKRTQLGTLVTDVYGSYMEPFLPKGEYIFEAAHSEFAFPTKATRPPHLQSRDFYKGEVIAVASQKIQQSVMIPMDAAQTIFSLRVLRYRLALLLSRILVALQWTVYPLSVLAVVAAFTQPNIWNIAICIVYLVIMALKLKQHFTAPTLEGRVVLEKNGGGVAEITLILNLDNGQLVAITKTDAEGHFEFFVKPGNYSISVVSDTFEWVENQSLTMNTVTVKEDASTGPLAYHVRRAETQRLEATLTSPFTSG